jgi:hypothetical protein
LKRIIRRYRLGYVVAATLCSIGLLALSVVLWKTWSQVYSTTNPISTFWDSLWKEQLSLIPGVQFKLAYFMILAAVTLISGIAVFAFSRQGFFLPSNIMRLQCPFCKKYWRASYDRGQVLCPHCRHLVHPRMTER